jgi:hypothetical protein
MFSCCVSVRGGAAPVLVAAANGLTLAGINGTILAIVVAALLGYFFVVFQSLDQMQTDLIERAHTIAEYSWGFQTDKYSVEGKTKDELRDMLHRLIMNLPAEAETSHDLPTDEAERGRAILVVASALATAEPFRVDPSALNDERSVRKWAEELLDAVGLLVVTIEFRTERLRALAKKTDEVPYQGPLPPELLTTALTHIGVDAEDILAQMGSAHINAMNGFIEFVSKTNTLANQLGSDIDRIDRYRNRLLSTERLGAGFAVIFVTFVCGVAIPMVRPSISSVFDAWVPAAIYAVGLLVAAFYLLRHYARRTS